MKTLPPDFPQGERPDLDEHAVDPAPHLVTDEELRPPHRARPRGARDRSRRPQPPADRRGHRRRPARRRGARLHDRGARDADDTATTSPAGHDPGRARPGDGGARRADAAPTLADAKGIAYEKFAKVDPTLPAVPAGAVKKFTVDVDQHVVQVSKDLAPVQAWTYTVNGKVYKGTAASPPIVVEQGDKVQITFVNGGSKAMHVNMAHSIDFHSAEVAPSKYYVDIAPGKKETISFVAKHPGVFMYHCATQPVLMHTGAGMTGMMVVKPRNLPKVDKELWMTQGEYYIGKPGGLADMDKMNAKKPDVIAFNGYADQYKASPITVRKGERVRMYVLNTGPSIWSAFHVIGTVFDTTARRGHHRPRLADRQPRAVAGRLGRVHARPGGQLPVRHALLRRHDARRGRRPAHHAARRCPRRPPAAPSKPASAAKADVNVTLGDMWVKSDVPSFKAGKVSFAVSNTGATGHGMGIVKAPAKLDGRHGRPQLDPRRGQGPQRRPERDAHRDAEARQVRADLPRARPLHGGPAHPVHRHQLARDRERRPTRPSQRSGGRFALRTVRG